MIPSSFLIQQAWLHSAPVLRSVNTSSHSLTFFFLFFPPPPCFSYLSFFLHFGEMFMHQIQGGNCNVISMIRPFQYPDLNLNSCALTFLDSYNMASQGTLNL